MRIIGGRLKGRRFDPPADNWPTRPTTDFAREALFNILSNRVKWDGLQVLDLFGGAGGITFECISRGCAQVTYVERFGKALGFVKRTAVTLGIEDQIQLVKGDVFRFLERETRSFGLIFADPPYDLDRLAELPDLILNAGLLEMEGLLVLEHGPAQEFGDHLRFDQSRAYGQSRFTFFR